MSDLLPQIEAFCATHEISERQFGEQAVNDKNFVRDLRDGREPRRATEAKVRSFMAEYQPQTAVPA